MTCMHEVEFEIFGDGSEKQSGILGGIGNILDGDNRF